MPHLIGREVQLYALAQAAAGTAASGNFNPIAHYGFTPRRTDPLVDDPLIGVSLANVMDPQPPTEGLVEAGFDIDLPLCFNQLGWILPHLFAVTAPSGAGPYTHVFNSGARAHAGLSLAWPDGPDWRLAHTVTWSRMEIGFTPEAGRRRVRLQGKASDITNPVSDPTGTPASQLALNTFAAGIGCQILYNSVAVANIMGGSVMFDRTLIDDRPIPRPDRTAKEFIPEVNPNVGGSLDIRPVDNTWFDIAASKDVDDLQLAFVTDASNKLTIDLPAVRFVPTQRPATGQGVRTERYEMRCEQTASAAAFKATLVNSIASYPGES